MNVLEFPTPNLLEKLILVFGSEGVVSLKHHIIQNTKWPHISIYWDMVSLGYNLWGHIGWCPTKSVNSIRWDRMNTKAEINQFQIFMTINENVFSFNISMNYIVFMKIWNRLGNYVQKLFSFSLLHSMFRLREQIIIQRISPSIFEH